MIMASNVKEIPIFAETNLGTRIVIAVSPEIIAKDFKVEFERAHSNCFPELGEIRVSGIKVKRKSCFYNLSESFPLKHVFHGSKQQFLHIEVCHLQGQSGCAESQAPKTCDHFSDFQDVTSTSKAQNYVPTAKKNNKRFKRKKRKMKRFFCFRAALMDVLKAAYFAKRNKKNSKKVRMDIAANIPENGPSERDHLSGDISCHLASASKGEHGKECLNQATECPSETFSEAMSVSGIIRRYFTNYDEVTSSSRFSFTTLQSEREEYFIGKNAMNYQDINNGMSSPLIAKTPPNMLDSYSLEEPSSKAIGSTHRKMVGTRLIAASEKLGFSTSKPNSALSLCKFRDRRSVKHKSTSTFRALVFGVTDEDD